jgi:hypothetical protein
MRNSYLTSKFRTVRCRCYKSHANLNLSLFSVVRFLLFDNPLFFAGPIQLIDAAMQLACCEGRRPAALFVKGTLGKRASFSLFFSFYFERVNVTTDRLVHCCFPCKNITNLSYQKILPTLFSF